MPLMRMLINTDDSVKMNLNDVKWTLYLLCLNDIFIVF